VSSEPFHSSKSDHEWQIFQVDQTAWLQDFVDDFWPTRKAVKRSWVGQKALKAFECNLPPSRRQERRNFRPHPLGTLPILLKVKFCLRPWRLAFYHRAEGRGAGGSMRKSWDERGPRIRDEAGTEPLLPGERFLRLGPT